MSGSNYIAAVARRWLWYLIWSSHGLAALVWWWLMPAGFAWGHLRFWSNTFVPLAVVVLSLLGIVAIRKPFPRLHSALACFLPFVWGAGAISVASLYPISGRRAAVFMLVSAGLYLVIVYRMWRRHPGPLPLAISIAIGAVGTGVLMARAQRAPDPDTRPLNQPLPESVGAGTSPPNQVRLNERVRFFPHEASVEVRCEGLVMEVHPLLTFISRSPDRFWTILAPPSLRVGPRRELTRWRTEPNTLQAQYQDDGTSALRLEAGPTGTILVEAHSRLAQPIFSHLNTWCSFAIRGRRDLSLSFSPCADERVAVTLFGYPVGRPLRIAYLGDDDVFRVVEANQGEKGPFHVLAEGPLTAGEPLTITIIDGDSPACRLVFEDWAAQVGRALSPTAGWGLPVNAIEFGRHANDPAGTGLLWLSLASTSVGRGWDSVGHAPGTYRNRLRVEPVPVDGVEPVPE
jgi:hypothetical protein